MSWHDDCSSWPVERVQLVPNEQMGLSTLGWDCKVGRNYWGSSWFFGMILSLHAAICRAKQKGCKEGEVLRGWPPSVSRASSPPWAKDSPTSASTPGERGIAVAFGELLDTPELAACPHPTIRRGGCICHGPGPRGSVSHLSGPPSIGGGYRRWAAPPPAPWETYSGRATCFGGTSIEVAT